MIFCKLQTNFNSTLIRPTMKLLNILATGILLSSIFPSISFSQETTSKPAAKQSDDAGLISLIRDNSQKITTAFNNGRADEIASMYLPTGELIDEAGTIYQGQEEIKNVMTEVFKRFPGTVLTIKIDSIRIVGPIGIEEGTRILTAKDGASKS